MTEANPGEAPASVQSNAQGRGGFSFRALAGFVAGLVVWLWCRSLRLRVTVDPRLDFSDPRPFVYACLHGQQLALAAMLRRRSTAVLVSLSRDGELQANLLPRLGFSVRRGSSSRGGATGLASIVSLLRLGRSDAAFAVDGPRGPCGFVHKGALVAARLGGGVVVPVASAAARRKVLSRSWDAFEIPLPFSAVAVVVGAPIEPSGAVDVDRERLQRALSGARAAALSLCGQMHG